MRNIKIAYIHRAAFPSTEANTFDSIWSADALTERADTTFFIPRLKTTKSKLEEYYEVEGTRLKIQSLHLNLIPDRILARFPLTYEKLLSSFFKTHPAWTDRGSKKVLYVREPKELLYWGLNRDKLYWMKDWIFCYEAHDTLGLDPQIFLDAVKHKNNIRSEKEQETLKAARNFNLMICNTQTLAEDMLIWSGNTLMPKVLILASPLPRLERPPKINFGQKITVGYIGTIDKFRGVDILLESLKYLPLNYGIRIVGRFRQEKNVDPNWLDEYLHNETLKDRLAIHLVDQIQDVAKEIDQCDILVQPASDQILDARYAAPLKSYGYMMRGKPILAGDVHCHRELFSNGRDAILYKLDAQNLAKSIQKVGKDPSLAEKIAVGAWRKSENFSFSRKVDDFFDMLDDDGHLN